MFPREESDGDINTLCNDLSEDESKTVDSRKIGEREVYLFFLENVHCYSPFECYLALPFHYCYSENKKEMKAEHLNIGKRKTVKK